MDAIEERLSKPVDWQEQYLWAILQELRDLRKILVPAETTGEEIKLREAAAEKS